MTKIYMIVGITAVIVAAYWVGGRVADAQCRADIVIKQSEANTHLQSKIIETKGRVNEETFNVGTVDIRDRLRNRYTIRD